MNEPNTSAFNKWFAGSKVVSADGGPLVMYHGTAANFTRFKAGEGDLGMHFGTTAQANMRIKNNGATDDVQVMPVYLNIRNPLRTKDAGDWDNEVFVSAILTDLMSEDDAFTEAYEKAVETVETSAGFKAVLEAMGYDGIVYANVGEEHFNIGDEAGEDSWIAFYPEQIKSALGNNGDFDAQNPDIRFSISKDQTVDAQDIPDGESGTLVLRNIWRSALRDELGKLNVNAQSGEAWRAQVSGMVSKGLVKAEEVKWAELYDFLSRQEGKVTKEQVHAYLKTRAIRTEAVMRYVAGETSAAVAKSLNLGETTVLRWISKFGKARTPSESRGVTTEKRSSAIGLYKAGNSISKVSSLTGLGGSTIHRMVVADGSNRSHADVNNAEEDVRNDAVSLYLLGLNTYEVASATGVSQPTIARWARQEGISRGYSGAQSLRIAIGRNPESPRGIKSTFTSQKNGRAFFAASIFELARMGQLECDPDVVFFDRSSDRIPLEGNRNYVPDLEITYLNGDVVVEEIKPEDMLGDAGVRAKAYAAVEFYKGSGKRYRIVTERVIGLKGFNTIDPERFPEAERKRIKAALATARWMTREATASLPKTASSGLPMFSFRDEQNNTASASLFKTGSLTFNKWAQGFPVVQSNTFPKKGGAVVIAVHSSQSDFSEFKSTQTWETHFGFHFGSSDQANKRITVRGTPLSGARSIPVYVRLTNPLRTTDAGTWQNPYSAWHVTQKALGTKKPDPIEFFATYGAAPSSESGTEALLAWRVKARQQLAREIKDAGYDGIVYKNRIEGQGDSFIALDPEQIKSTIGNNGEYSSDNPDIRMSFAGDKGLTLVANPPAFIKWFGDSKVVDAEGAPLVVYHGTSGNFTIFDEAKQGQTAGVKGGYFFTSSKEVASDVYGWREGGKVMEAYLHIENPLGFDQYFKESGKDKDLETNGGFDAPVNYFDNNADEITKFAKENGYDGIMWPADPDSELEHDLIVVFDPAQIKLSTELHDSVSDKITGPGTFEDEKTGLEEWLKNSQVIDASGAPLVVYHGTALGPDTDIQMFNQARQPAKRFAGSVGNFHGIGPFFSESPLVADSFPASFGLEDTKRVYPVLLNIENPKRYKTLNQAQADFNTNYDGDPIRFASALAQKGHDGIYFLEGPSWAGKRKALQAGTWIPFSTEQIKSALGHNADFDGSSPNVRLSFAGIRALTANSAALETAQASLAAGIDSELVRRDTGWSTGVDGQWRFEINDAQASIKLDVKPGSPVSSEVRVWQLERARLLCLGDLLDHPSLFLAYPELQYFDIRFLSSTALPGRAALAGNEIWLAEDMGPVEVLFALHHELQHAIQNLEGFAVGGTPTDFDPKNAERARDILNYRKELERFMTDTGIDPKTNADAWLNAENGLVQRYSEMLAMDWLPSPEIRDEARRVTYKAGQPGRSELERIVSAFGLNKKVTATSALAMYERLAGEVEARNTQARQHLSPEGRRATPPSQTSDTKEDDVIVAFESEYPQAFTSGPTHVERVTQAISKVMGPRAAQDSGNFRVFGAGSKHDLPKSIAALPKGAQAFHDHSSGITGLVASNIAPGSEISVLLHEITHKHGKRAMPEATWDKLIEVLRGWEDRAAHTTESKIFAAAARRAAKHSHSPEEFDEELFAYAVEEAVDRGIKPTAMATENSAEHWLNAVVTSLFEMTSRMTNAAAPALTSQDVVDFAYALAQLERPEHAYRVREALWTMYEQVSDDLASVERRDACAPC